MNVTIRDMLDLYALKHNSDDLTLMLQDYELDSRLSRDNLNTRIVLHLGERESYYGDTTLLKYAIENFFQVNAWNIEKLVDTMYAEFDPMQDTNYFEDEEKDIELNRKDTEDETIKNTQAKKKDNTQNKKQVVDDDKTRTENTETTTHDTSEEQVSAYNVSSYQPRSQNIADGTSETDTSGKETDDKTTTENNTENTTENNTEDTTRDWDGTRHDKTDDDRQLHVYGLKNGHTYQELIKAERDNAEFNIYDYIIRKLKREICLMIWR